MINYFFFSEETSTYAFLGLIWFISISLVIVKIELSSNDALRIFGDSLQYAIQYTETIQLKDILLKFLDILKAKILIILVKSFLNFTSRKYILYWRISLSKYYLDFWHEIHSQEGAAQRIQEDTMRFCTLFEMLFIKFLHDLFIAVAYLPLLASLSRKIPKVWIFPKVPNFLLALAICIATIGSIISLIPGVYIPKAIVDIDKSEAALRKELVLGEILTESANIDTLQELYKKVENSYYIYYYRNFFLNILKTTYIQLNAITLWLTLSASLVRPFTLGLLKQTMDAFDKVSATCNFIMTHLGELAELIALYIRLRKIELIISKCL
ncbi:hypothetical protein cand_029460 [Cryptosporidium andersoni]|uniref:SbmA/BacA-like family protein n=1 Tax=Cryptosporidium andersoni TaxID=117008 RepID=A0A1J4MS32_9CRYT|nr:hypothetical protein cand_029460 [Cryptosporidium andersoni]